MYFRCVNEQPAFQIPGFNPCGEYLCSHWACMDEERVKKLPPAPGYEISNQMRFRFGMPMIKKHALDAFVKRRTITILKEKAQNNQEDGTTTSQIP